MRHARPRTRLEKLLREDSGRRATGASTSAETPVRFYLPLDARLCRTTLVASAVIMTQGPRGARPRASRPGSARARRGARSASAVARIAPLELGPPVGWPIKYRVSGDGSPEQVRKYAFEVARIVMCRIATSGRSTSTGMNRIEAIRVRRRPGRGRGSSGSLATELAAGAATRVMSGRREPARAQTRSISWAARSPP